MIGELYTVAFDCPDPRALARFYAELLGMKVTRDSDEWVEISDGRSRVSFQFAPDHQPPRWPDPAFPQQAHLDVLVADVDVAEPRVLGLGARRLDGEGEDFRVYADPAGHPFCLVWETATPEDA